MCVIGQQHVNTEIQNNRQANRGPGAPEPLLFMG